jgi:hypothetical protein
VSGKRIFDFGAVTFGSEATRPRLTDAPAPRPGRPDRGVAPPEPRGPMPVVVGVPRSGTTLLAVMLDSHPRIAMPPETAFLTELGRLDGLAGDALERGFVELVTTDRWGVSNWNDLGLDKGELAQRLRELTAFSVGAGLRVLFGMYADRAGKALFGEKTPADATHMPRIASFLPEARFIHIVRDPRDVVLSLAKTSAGAGVQSSAQTWVDMIGAARAASRGLDHYHELRYEDLLDDPERKLREICAFLDLDFDARMLDYGASGERHVAHLGDRMTPDGRAMVPKALRARIHENLARPIRKDRVGQWRNGMGDEDRATVEAIAGPLMRELGYL